MSDRILEARLKWRAAGDYCENVLHYYTDSADNPFHLAVLLYNDMAARGGSIQFMDKLLGLMSDTCFLSTLTVRQIFPVGGLRIAQQFESTDYVGTETSAIYSTEVAALINLICVTEAGKLGRMYIPGIGTDALDGGRWSSGFKTEAESFANELVAGFTTGVEAFLPVVFRRKDPFSTSTWRLVNDGYLSPNVGQLSQRGRGE